MRVRAHVDALVGQELGRAHLVEEDEGADHLPLRPTAGPGEPSSRRGRPHAARSAVSIASALARSPSAGRGRDSSSLASSPVMGGAGSTQQNGVGRRRATRPGRRACRKARSGQAFLEKPSVPSRIVKVGMSALSCRLRDPGPSPLRPDNSITPRGYIPRFPAAWTDVPFLQGCRAASPHHGTIHSSTRSAQGRAGSCLLRPGDHLGKIRLPTPIRKYLMGSVSAHAKPDDTN